jgi:thiamine-monophosphate kinase
MVTAPVRETDKMCAEGTTLKSMGEFGFMDRVCGSCLQRPEGVVVGIGDDAAAFTACAERLALLTTDMLVEGVHFHRHLTSGEDLGHKALAVNLSDIAAMGGTPREAFISIAIPSDCGLTYLEAIYTGMRALASEYRVNILGGDTTRSLRDLVINVALTGSVAADEMLRRKGARPGDRLAVTGYLGDSRAGLHLIQNRLPAETEGERRLLEAHRRPRPHLAQGRFLARSGAVTAAMDLSDGLSSDLAHILTQSGVGGCIQAECLPVSAALRAFCRHHGGDPIQLALAGGEDYVLLCTLDPKWAQRLIADYQDTFNLPLTVIGEITATVGTAELVAADGSRQVLQATGWDHFKNR